MAVIRTGESRAVFLDVGEKLQTPNETVGVEHMVYTDYVKK